MSRISRDMNTGKVHLQQSLYNGGIFGLPSQGPHVSGKTMCAAAKGRA